VSDVAAVVDVSEKTIFNYFPTKESLVFDMEDHQAEQITRVLRDSPPGVGLVRSIVAMLEADIDELIEQMRDEDGPGADFTTVRRFAEMIENSATLTAAMYGMQERLALVAATVLAERVGVDPDDPEPQQAAVMVLGLWRMSFRAMIRHADEGIGIEELRAAVMDDICRAASVAEGGIASFDLVVGPSSGKDAVARAAKAAEVSSRQLMAAVKEARESWKQVVVEFKAHAREQDEAARRESAAELRLNHREYRDEIRRLKREYRQQAMATQRAKAEVRRAQSDAWRSRR
jgi:AcrR family transcriptional regulator